MFNPTKHEQLQRNYADAMSELARAEAEASDYANKAAAAAAEATAARVKADIAHVEMAKFLEINDPAKPDTGKMPVLQNSEPVRVE